MSSYSNCLDRISKRELIPVKEFIVLRIWTFQGNIPTNMNHSQRDLLRNLCCPNEVWRKETDRDTKSSQTWSVKHQKDSHGVTLQTIILYKTCTHAQYWGESKQPVLRSLWCSTLLLSCLLTQMRSCNPSSIKVYQVEIIVIGWNTEISPPPKYSKSF